MFEYEDLRTVVGFRPLQGLLVIPSEKFAKMKRGVWGKPVWFFINPYLRQKLLFSNESGSLTCSCKVKLDGYEWSGLNRLFRGKGWVWKDGCWRK